MARPISLVSVLPIHVIPSVYAIFAVISVLCIFSLVTFLCASHKRQKHEAFITRRKLTIAKKNLLESFSKANNVSCKALLRIVSWRKQVQHGDDDEDDDINNNAYYDVNSLDYIGFDNEGFRGEDAVWKKTIIKGEKCKPLDFSGKIEYDCEGNLLPDHNDKSHDENET